MNGESLWCDVLREVFREYYKKKLVLKNLEIKSN